MPSDFEKVLNQPVDETNYFTLLPYLKALQEQVRRVKGLAARDLILQLEHEAFKAGFNPVGNHQQGKTPDAYFAAYPEIGSLEARLILKINAENVSEILELIRKTDYYKPTRPVLQAIQATYLNQLNANPD
jgi:hypothetical protein